MKAIQLVSKFAKMGARLKVREIPSRWRQGDLEWLSPGNYSLDIKRDRCGEFFELRIPTHLRESLEAIVVQCKPQLRHLLLFVRTLDGPPRIDRFLCGHDEREWFLAAVPGGASSVRQAMDVLQPTEVRDALTRHDVPWSKCVHRKTRAFLRQGEWFFVPAPDLEVNEDMVFHHEPIRRGGGKPHLVEMLYRTGGRTVHVHREYPNGLTSTEYRLIVRLKPWIARWNWQVMRRDPTVYARGTVRHQDHAALVLSCWHRVLMNTESQSRTFSGMAFLD